MLVVSCCYYHVDNHCHSVHIYFCLARMMAGQEQRSQIVGTELVCNIYLIRHDSKVSLRVLMDDGDKHWPYTSTHGSTGVDFREVSPMFPVQKHSTTCVV